MYQSTQFKIPAKANAFKTVEYINPFGASNSDSHMYSYKLIAMSGLLLLVYAETIVVHVTIFLSGNSSNSLCASFRKVK